MTKETAQALGDLVDRLIRPVITTLFALTICWLGLRSIQAISADQFVGIVMAVILFWFGSRPSGTSSGGPQTTTTQTADTKTVTGPTAAPGG